MKKIFNYSNLFEERIPYDKNTEVLISKCVIPKIQRAYAQGRREESYVRNNLLKELFTSLYEGREIDLNFIYGAVHKQDDNNRYTFEIIDGQQRLTTLYLLYWYIGNRELDHDSDEYKRLVTNLSKFVYETRATATDFCQYLAAFSAYGRPKDPHQIEYPSVSIKDAKWYFRSFEKDSTIEGMLRMLDAIHNQYQKLISQDETIALYQNLDKLTFYVLSLGEFGLTEELYIKMNARGLSLSPFDNFKAELIGYLRSIELGQTTVKLGSSMKGTEVPYYLDFSTRMDTKWINVFWNKDNIQYDADYFRFFNRYLANKYSVDVQDIKVEDIRFDKTLRFFAVESENADRYLGFIDYQKRFDEHPEYFHGIKKVLDTFEQYYDDTIYPAIVPIWDDPDKNPGFFGPKITQVMRIIFFGVTEFIEAYDEFRPEVFRKWMRVLWNIVENTNIDNFSKLAALNRSLRNILHHAANAANEGVSFYAALSKYRSDENGDDFDTLERSRAIQEEIIKAGCISEDELWEETFIEAEKHPFFKGMVVFFYTKGMSIESFKHRYEMVSEIFDKDGVTGQFRAEGHLLLRAIISQLKNWKEMIRLNMTDKAETQKYLKHWISANQNIHDLFAMCLDSSSHEEILDFLRSLVDEPSQITVNGANPDTIAQYRKIHEALYKKKSLQNWLQDNDAYRLVEFKGNIFMAKKNSWTYKIMMDTERNRFVPMISDKYGYKNDNSFQVDVWKNTGFFNGNEIELKKNVDTTEIIIVFSNFSEMLIKVRANDSIANSLREEFELEELPVADDGWRQLAKDTYNKKDFFNYLEKTYLKKIENVLDI